MKEIELLKELFEVTKQQQQESVPQIAGVPITKPIDGSIRWDNDPRDEQGRWPGHPGFDWSRIREEQQQISGPRPRRHEAAGAENDLRRLACAMEDVAAAIEFVGRVMQGGQR